MSGYSSLNRSSPDKIREWQRRSKGLDRRKSIDRGERVTPTSKLRAKPLPAGERARRADVRERIYARDGGCVLRASSAAGACFGPLTPHHLRKASQGGEYDDDNMVTLCSHHNTWVEDHPNEAHALGLVRRRGDA